MTLKADCLTDTFYADLILLKELLRAHSVAGRPDLAEEVSITPFFPLLSTSLDNNYNPTYYYIDFCCSSIHDFLRAEARFTTQELQQLMY